MESMRGMMSPVEGCTDIWGCKINLIISKYVLNSTVYREVKTEWWKTSCGVLLSEQFVKEAALQEKWAGFSLIKTRGMKIILVRFIRKTLLIFKMKSVLLHDRKFWEWVFTGFFLFEGNWNSILTGVQLSAASALWTHPKFYQSFL